MPPPPSYARKFSVKDFFGKQKGFPTSFFDTVRPKTKRQNRDTPSFA